VVVDSSALVAVLGAEPEQERLVDALEASAVRLLSTATFVESSIVVEARHGAVGVRDLDRFLARAGVELVPVAPEHAYAARDAFARYGKGRHRAGLNFGDCFTYALASLTNEPVLCKGDDFAHTDLAVVQV